MPKKSNKFDYKFALATVFSALLVFFFNYLEGNNSQDTLGQSTSNNLESAIVIDVLDGDTFKIQSGANQYNVRLIGIDTPETIHPNKPVQCFGQEAKNYLTKLILNKQVRMEKDISETDRFGRLLRYVYLDNEFINNKMVKEGYAFSVSFPPDTKYQEMLDQSENYAYENDIGLWNEDTCGGIVE